MINLKFNLSASSVGFTLNEESGAATIDSNAIIGHIMTCDPMELIRNNYNPQGTELLVGSVVATHMKNGFYVESIDVRASAVYASGERRGVSLFSSQGGKLSTSLRVGASSNIVYDSGYTETIDLNEPANTKRVLTENAGIVVLETVDDSAVVEVEVNVKVSAPSLHNVPVREVMAASVPVYTYRKEGLVSKVAFSKNPSNYTDTELHAMHVAMTHVHIHENVYEMVPCLKPVEINAKDLKGIMRGREIGNLGTENSLVSLDGDSITRASLKGMSIALTDVVSLLPCVVQVMIDDELCLAEANHVHVTYSDLINVPECVSIIFNEDGKLFDVHLGKPEQYLTGNKQPQANLIL